MNTADTHRYLHDKLPQRDTKLHGGPEVLHNERISNGNHHVVLREFINLAFLRALSKNRSLTGAVIIEKIWLNKPVGHSVIRPKTSPVRTYQPLLAVNITDTSNRKLATTTNQDSH